MISFSKGQRWQSRRNGKVFVVFEPLHPELPDRAMGTYEGEEEKYGHRSILLPHKTLRNAKLLEVKT